MGPRQAAAREVLWSHWAATSWCPRLLLRPPGQICLPLVSLFSVHMLVVFVESIHVEPLMTFLNPFCWWSCRMTGLVLTPCSAHLCCDIWLKVEPILFLAIGRLDLENTVCQVNVSCMPNFCVLVSLLLCFQMWWHHFFFLIYTILLIHLSACLSVCVSSADININSPPTNPTCKKQSTKQDQVGLCLHAKTTTKFVFQKTLAGLDLDGDFFIPVLSAAMCCCVTLSSYDAQSQYGLTSS